MWFPAATTQNAPTSSCHLLESCSTRAAARDSREKKEDDKCRSNVPASNVEMDVLREKEVRGTLSDDILRESRDPSCHSALETSRGCPMRACSLDEHLNSSHQLTLREMPIITVDWNLPARASSGMHLFKSDVMARHFCSLSLFNSLSLSLSFKFVDVFANVSFVLINSVCVVITFSSFLILNASKLATTKLDICVVHFSHSRQEPGSICARSKRNFGRFTSKTLHTHVVLLPDTSRGKLFFDCPCLAPNVQTEAPRQSHVCVQKRTVL